MTLMDGYTRVRLTPEIAGRPGAGGPDDWESVSAPMAPSFFPRRLCRPTCRAHRARGGWNHSRRCPRDIRPPEPLHCPVDMYDANLSAGLVRRQMMKCWSLKMCQSLVTGACATAPSA